MSYENNLFAPLVDATVDVIYSVSCLLGKLLFGESNRFDIENFFKVCELKNSRGEYPVLCKKVDIDRGTKFILSLPIGLCLKDFLKLKDALEQQIKTKVVINYNNGYIEILSILDFFLSFSFVLKYHLFHEIMLTILGSCFNVLTRHTQENQRLPAIYIIFFHRQIFFFFNEPIWEISKSGN